MGDPGIMEAFDISTDIFNAREIKILKGNKP